MVIVLLAAFSVGRSLPSVAAEGDVVVTGVLVVPAASEDTSPTPVNGAGMSLRFYDDRGFWNVPDLGDGSNAFATTAADGSFTFNVPPATLAGKQWLLSVTPPFSAVGATPTLGATALPVPAGLASATGAFDLGTLEVGAPDIIGTVLSGGSPAPHEGAVVSLTVPVGEGTASLPFEFITIEEVDNPDGRFALRRPDLAAFDSLTGAAKASLGAAPAMTLSIRDRSNALPAFELDLTEDGVDPTAISATFPTPNISGTLRLPDNSAVGSASYMVEREELQEIPGGVIPIWAYAGVGGQTLNDGTFAIAFDFPTGVDAAPHRLRFESPPSGGPYASFSVPLTDDAGAMLSGLTSLTPQYQEADIFGTLLNGDDSPVQNGVVTVQRRVTDEFGDRWEWTVFFASPNQSGEFAISIDGSDADNFSTAGWRLRATVFNNDGSDIGFAVPLANDGSDWLTQALVVPTPNLTGTVTAPIGPDGASIAIANAGVELRRYNSTFDYWEWTDAQTVTADDGTFSLVLPDEERSNRLELRIRPQGNFSGVLPAFSSTLPYPLAEDEDLTGLDIVAPTPDLQGIVRTGDTGVAGAWVQLERLAESPFGEFWEWAEGFATTSSNGRFALNASNIDASARYRVRVIPPYSRTAELVEFTVELPGTGVSGGIELDFPTPNVGGTVVDPSGNAVSDAWVNIQVWNETGGYWEWLTSAVTRTGTGAFALYLDPAELGDRPARLDVRAPGDRDDLVAFQVDLSLTDGGAGFPGLAFPSPNLTVTIERDSGAPVRGAYAWVERISEDGSEQTDLWQSTGQAGRLSLRVAEAGNYRLHVHGPWGQDLPTFQRDFSVGEEGTVTGIVTDSTLTFPTPNLTIDVNDAGGDPVQFAHIELRRYDATADEWVWVPQNGTADRSGIAKLALEAGTYRVYVHPPWFATDLTIGLVEVDVPESGSVSKTVALTGPNLTGTLAQGTGVTGWSWIEVTPPDGDPAVPGGPVAPSGSTAGQFGLKLPTDGDHQLTVWPGEGSAYSAPLEVVVTISGGEVSAWRYAVQTPATNNCPGAPATCTLDLDFADPALAANLGGTVTRDGEAVAGAFVTANATAEGSSGTPADWQGFAVTGADGTFSLRIPSDVTVSLFVAIPEGDGVLVASLPGERDATSGLALDLEVGGLLTPLGTPPSAPPS